MESIEQHIEKDKELARSTLSPQMRRHTADELEHLERYAQEHKKDIEAGDHHDPSALKCIVMRILMQMNVKSTIVETVQQVAHGGFIPAFFMYIKEVEGRPTTNTDLT